MIDEVRRRRVREAIAKLPPNSPKRAEILDLEEVERCNESLRDFGFFAWHIMHPRHPYVHGYHVDAITEHLEAISNGIILNLLINVPPGTGKSFWTNVFWPAWEWGPRNRPDLKHVSFSYTSSLTIRDNTRMRRVIESEWYRSRWGHRFKLTGDVNSKIKFENDKTGFKFASSMGGVSIGERGDRLILDDPNNVLEAESDVVRESANMFVREVLPSRVNNPETTATVITQQRTHVGDVSGTVLGNEAFRDFVHLFLPMHFDPKRICVISQTGFKDRRTVEGELLWPQFYTEERVNALAAKLGPYAAAGQLEQRPSPRGGGMFKLSWFRFFQTGRYGRPLESDASPAVELPSLFDCVIISCDPKFKKKPSRSRVGLLVIGFHGPNVYILEDHTKDMSPAETEDAVEALAKNYPFATVLIEEAAAGTAIIEVLKTRITGVVEVRPDGGKVARAGAAESTLKSHCVHLPEGAPWLDEFCGEFTTFPVGIFKDRVDAWAQAIIHWLTNMEDLRTYMAMSKMGELFE